MAGLADRIEMTRFAQERPRCSDWAPYRDAAQQGEARHGGRRLSGIGMLAAFLLFSGVTVTVARGNVGMAESYGISAESLLVVAWLLQGAAALFGFLLALRWLRS